jgi:predicted anti-sigma-YlaC factor YlaD
VTDPFIHDDAVYVLGALSEPERRAFEAHLATCPDCRARVAEVSPLPRLLAGLPEEAFRPVDEPVPETALPGLLRAVGRERRRRRGLLATLGGLAAACVIALTVVVAWPSQHSAGPTPQAMSALVANPVHATAALRDVGWGTEIRLVCHYDEGYGSGFDYALQIVDKNGGTHPAGTWRLTPGKVTTFIGGTALPRSQIASVQITLPSGTPILQLKV